MYFIRTLCSCLWLDANMKKMSVYPFRVSLPCEGTRGKNTKYCSGNPLLGVWSGALTLKLVSVLPDRSVMG